MNGTPKGVSIANYQNSDDLRRAGGDGNNIASSVHSLGVSISVQAFVMGLKEFSG